MSRSHLIDPNHDPCEACHHARWKHYKGPCAEPKCACTRFVERTPRKRKKR